MSFDTYGGYIFRASITTKNGKIYAKDYGLKGFKIYVFYHGKKRPPRKTYA